MKNVGNEKLVVTKSDVRMMMRACAQAKGIAYRPTTIYGISDSLFMRSEWLTKKLHLEFNPDAAVDYLMAVEYAVSKATKYSTHRLSADEITEMTVRLHPMLEENYERRDKIKNNDGMRILVGDISLSLALGGLVFLISPSENKETNGLIALLGVLSTGALAALALATVQRIRDAFGSESRRLKDVAIKIEQVIAETLKGD